MAFEQVKLSKREQWAQNLKEELAGMIPLADFWACYFDHLDKDDIEMLPTTILMAQGTGVVFHIAAKKIVRRMNDEQKKDYRSARAAARSLYDSDEAFKEAEDDMLIEMLLSEPYQDWDD